MRKLLRVDLLVVDDFALQPLDALDTADVYELIVERHCATATIVTSNRCHWRNGGPTTLASDIAGSGQTLVTEDPLILTARGRPCPQPLAALVSRTGSVEGSCSS